MSVFREYIGGKSSLFHGGVPLDQFGAAINPDVPEVHLILAFARDDGYGNFTAQWDTNTYDPEAIIRIKQQVPNLKAVVLSIGGPRAWSLGGSPVTFNPLADANEWVNHATQSLRGIIQKYHLDGIDVNYEKIDATREVFANCIGPLIVALKQGSSQQPPISVASIAPSILVDQTHYLPLFQQFRHLIDLVNYQFYDEDVSTVNVFVNRYKTLLNTYNIEPKVLLPGLSTDPNDQGRLTPDVFIEGSRQLKAQNLLCGVFIWSADDSAPNTFMYGRIAQALLVRN